MRYISSAELRSNPALLWKEGEDTDTIITVNGKPKVISIPIHGEPEEVIDLIRRLRAEQAIEHMWQKSKESSAEKLKLSDINKEIREVRNEMIHE